MKIYCKKWHSLKSGIILNLSFISHIEVWRENSLEFCFQVAQLWNVKSQVWRNIFYMKFRDSWFSFSCIYNREHAITALMKYLLITWIFQVPFEISQLLSNRKKLIENSHGYRDDWACSALIDQHEANGTHLCLFIFKFRRSRAQQHWASYFTCNKTVAKNPDYNLSWFSNVLKINSGKKKQKSTGDQRLNIWFMHLRSWFKSMSLCTHSSPSPHKKNKINNYGDRVPQTLWCLELL